MKFFAPLVLALGLTACTTTGTPGDQAQYALDAANSVYLGYCARNVKATGCTKGSKQKAKDAYALAETAITDYNAGTLTQAELSAAIQQAVKVFADFQK